jgi:hypothetical protein
MNQFKLKMRTADVKEQADFYENKKGESLKAIYKKDKDGLIDIFNISYELLGETWVGNRDYIIENTDHAQATQVNVNAIYASDREFKKEKKVRAQVALNKFFEEWKNN